MEGNDEKRWIGRGKVSSTECAALDPSELKVNLRFPSYMNL